MYMGTVVCLVLEGDPIGYYDGRNCHCRGGEEDDERATEDNASGQHPRIIIYARHLSREGRAPNIVFPPSARVRVTWSSRCRTVLCSAAEGPNR
jgi:hypothetical protein